MDDGKSKATILIYNKGDGCLLLGVVGLNDHKIKSHVHAHTHKLQQ